MKTSSIDKLQPNESTQPLTTSTPDVGPLDYKTDEQADLRTFRRLLADYRRACYERHAYSRLTSTRTSDTE